MCAVLYSFIFLVQIYTSSVKYALLPRILSLSIIIQTYGCLAISLLSMALSFPESSDKTADSIVTITINLQLIVLVLEVNMVSIENRILQKSPAPLLKFVLT